MRVKRNYGLAFKISFYVLSCSAIIFLSIFIYNYKISKNILLENVKENTKNLTLSSVNQIETILTAVSKPTENLAMVLESNDFSEEQIHALLKVFTTKNKEIYGACIAYEPYTFSKDIKLYAPYYFKKNPDKLNYENLNDEKYMYPNWDWYKDPKELNKSVWTEPYFDDGGGNIIMATYSVPFYKIENNKPVFKGVVTADVSLKWLTDIISKMKLYQTGYAFLISKSGKIITHPESNLIMKETIFSVAEKRKAPIIKKIGEKMVRGESGFMDLKKVKSWLYFNPLPSNSWSLGVVIPEKELYEDLTKLNHTIIALGIIGFIFLFILVTSIAKKIVRPIKDLVKATEIIACGNFDTKIPVVKSKDEIFSLTFAFTIMLDAIKLYIKNLEKTTIAKEKIESELKIAHDIQMSIIPKLFPAFPHRKEFDLYAVIEPAKAVGGDLYDFFLMDDSHLFFAIGDVSGKGVPASLFMAVTRTLLRAKSIKGSSSLDVVKSINATLCEDNESSMFVTFLLGILTIETGEIELCNAGHNPPFIKRKNGEIEKLAIPSGMALGIFDQQKFEILKLKLEKDEELILYTDGVTESTNVNSKLFEDARLIDVLKQNTKTTKETTLNILQAVKKFSEGAEQSDDITIFTLKYF